jgi:hypothetical protein
LSLVLAEGLVYGFVLFAMPDKPPQITRIGSWNPSLRKEQADNLPYNRHVTAYEFFAHVSGERMGHQNDLVAWRVLKIRAG